VALGFVAAVGNDHRNPWQKHRTGHRDDLEPAVHHEDHDQAHHADAHGHGVLDHPLAHVLGVRASGIRNAMDLAVAGEPARFFGRGMSRMVFKGHGE